MSEFFFFRFPEMYAHGEKPPKRGTRVMKNPSLFTPPYAYGWIISADELFEAIYKKECDSPFRRVRMPEDAEQHLYTRWTEKGLQNTDYSPSMPATLPAGDDHVLIYMADNDTEEMMDGIMADKNYHQACRDCLGNPKTMQLDPAWFLGGVKGIPKGFIPAVHDGSENDLPSPSVACMNDS